MQVTAMDIYRLLPQTNCEDCDEAACGEASCMAFATKLSEKEAQLELCTEISSEGFAKLESLLAPAVREITIGNGDKTTTIGGDEVLYRYELTYYNPTSLVIDVSDNLSDAEFTERVKVIEETEFERIGEMLTLDRHDFQNAMQREHVIHVLAVTRNRNIKLIRARLVVAHNRHVAQRRVRLVIEPVQKPTGFFAA